MVIPAPSAVPDVSPEPKLRVIFLSSTSNVAVFKDVVVPLTVKFPVIVASTTVKFLEASSTVVPEPEPCFITPTT